MHDEMEAKSTHYFRRENGSWDVLKLFGAFLALLGVVPLLVWLYELIMHVRLHPGDDFSPALEIGDLWYFLFPMLGLGIGLVLGYGRELVETLIEWIKSKT